LKLPSAQFAGARTVPVRSKSESEEADADFVTSWCKWLLRPETGRAPIQAVPTNRALDLRFACLRESMSA